MPVIVELHEDCYWCPFPLLSMDTTEVMKPCKGYAGETGMEKTCVIRCEHMPVCKIVEEAEHEQRD